MNPESKITWREIRRTRWPFNWKTVTDDSVMREILAQKLPYLNTNVWCCTILHKDCLMETVSLLMLWNNKHLQHFVVPFCIYGARFRS